MRFKFTEVPKTWEELNVQTDWWWIHRLTLDNSTWLFLPNTLANKPRQVVKILDSTWQELGLTNTSSEYKKEPKVTYPEQDDEALTTPKVLEEPILEPGDEKDPEAISKSTDILVEPEVVMQTKKIRKPSDLKPIESMSFSQINDELRKKSKRLKEAINRKDGPENIDRLRKYVKDLASTILLTTSARHKAKWQDIDFLNNLELDYLMKWFVCDLQLAQKIVITEDYIQVAWLEIRRYDEQAPFVKDAGIIKTKDEQYTLFKIGAAKKHAASIWCSILSIEQLKQIISAMPWRTREEKEYNFINIFNISFAGFFSNYDVIFHWFWEYGAYWMNPPKANKRLSITKIDKNKVHPSSYTRRYDAHALRCVKKSW